MTLQNLAAQGSIRRMHPVRPFVSFVALALAFVPFHARAWDGVWIAAAALAISLLATLYPSLSAARLNPVEILRYE